MLFAAERVRVCRIARWRTEGVPLTGLVARAALAAHLLGELLGAVAQSFQGALLGLACRSHTLLALAKLLFSATHLSLGLLQPLLRAHAESLHLLLQLVELAAQSLLLLLQGAALIFA